ncbi:peptidase S8/S53 domain-containing protein [Gilbertella persicaria]|uniref:peptidase S8/S53 domain-containing protein n=1 Tax=Gilbertella persicaria TaxID=101096 RepID=UPI00221F39F6|nr:peptidase S8/S53 domain-containing protein [Gilbertella persicaria]KAI8075789.1 peptidase S8/S53 domain-containing protein [Gilbertella persicaria]
MFIKITRCILLLSLFHLVQPKKTGFVPYTYVVEFEKTPSVLSKRALFYDQLDHHNINYTVRHEYQLIHAVSIAFKSEQDTALFFEKVPGIKKAWPVNTITKPSFLHVQNDAAISSNYITPLFDHYNNTGVSKVRDELGMTGKGIKVGIIDTGVDYMHPALGGCFGPNCRVAYGYDFVGDAYTGENLPMPDQDPRDNCNGHGTHVAGIIGAKDAHFTGVAPDVILGAYRIFGCSGSSADDVIMKAMEAAYLDGMDIINLSLGDIGWPESPSSLLADELALRGMVVCAAAGNEGEKGMFEVGAPSLGEHALSIASVDNGFVLSHTFQLNNMTIGYTTATGKVFDIGEAQIVPTSTFLAANDACNPLQLDLKGKVALVNRGGCMFSRKIMHAANAGAVGVLIYNNAPGPITPSVSEHAATIEYGGISYQDGNLLFQHISQDKAVFSPQDVSFPVPTAGFISDFSSWGLGPDLSLKPDLSAPGGQMYSTYPLDLGSYATLSGTSMASPYVAGIVALLQESRGGNRAISAQEVRTMLLNNGHPFGLFDHKQHLDSVARQGAGLVDVYRAITTDTFITPEQIRLNDIDHGAANHEYTLTIKNNGRMATEYTIGHVVASSAQAYQSLANTLLPLSKPAMLTNGSEAQVQAPATVLVQANEQKNITVRITPPTQALPPSIYSGYITVTKTHNPSDIKYVPYAGMTSKLSQLPVLLVNNTMPRMINEKVNVFSPALLSFQLIESTPLLTIAAVNASNPSQNFGLIPGGYTRYLGRNSIQDPNDVLLLSWYGNVANSPEQASLGPLSRHQSTTTFVTQDRGISQTGMMGNQLAALGIKLPQGSYQLKVMALRPFGRDDDEEDYDIWYSPNIQIN